MSRKKILAILGSTRQNSSNELILNYIQSKYADRFDVKIYKELAELPHFNPDVPDDGIHENVRAFRNEITNSDGVIICTPEYVFNLPGTLKNALEWTVSTTVFSDKPVAIIVASGLGEKTFESLNLIMRTLGARFGEQSTILIQGARAKLRSQTPDEDTRSNIDALMKSLMDSINTSLMTD
jgi:NAD(P)H-dependent FMN reductase